MTLAEISQIIREEFDDFCFEAALVEIDQITQAKDLARDVHKGQWRKSSPLPYTVHPMRVYRHAKKLGLSKRHQVLSIIHDTYEDARNPERTLKKIKDMFGNKITNLVKYLSHDKGVDYNLYLLKLAKSSPTAFDVKLLDIEDNLTDNPSGKQREKYKNALNYLVQNGININPKIKKNLFNLAGV